MTNNPKDGPIYRILDAAGNRAAEGLRVLEDYARMHLNDRFLTSELKTIRHALVDAYSNIDARELLHSRNTLGDVGTTIQTTSEYKRKLMQNVIASNFARVQQSLRTIEEYAKTISSTTSQDVEQLRYQTYTLEKALVNTSDSITRLGGTILYVLTDTRDNIDEFDLLIAELVDAEVDLIQLRDKHLDDGRLLDAGKLLSQQTRGRKTRWIMNDRPDLAILSGADGVHVGQNDLPVADVRQIVGTEKIVGVSTHNIEQAFGAVLDGANYIGVGPVFPSETKSFDQFASDVFLKQVVKEISLPTFAIGGINSDNLGTLLEIGIQRIAVSNSVIESESPKTAIREFKDKILGRTGDSVSSA